MSNGRRGWSGGVVAGILLVIVGAAFLLRNMGLLGVGWDVLWPVLLIVLGLLVLVPAVGIGRSRGDGSGSVAIPVDGSRRLELSMSLGAGRYRLAGGSASLVEVASNEPTVVSRVDRRGDVARVRLTPDVGWWAWAWRTPIDWQITVSGEIPATLELQAGAGAFDLDLSAIQLASASIAIGAAELRVVLPRPRGDVPVRVEGGAASMTFHVPPGVEARVSSTGLVATSGRSETPGYAAATDRVTVSVTGGAASVRVT